MGLPPAFWAALSAIVGMVVGAFAPWCEVLILNTTATTTGIEGGDGWIVLGGAALGTVGLIRRTHGGGFGWLVAGGVTGALVAIIDYVAIERDTGIFGEDVVGAAWGIYLVLAASVALTASGIALRKTASSGPGETAPR